jgi:hypothetical protein
MIAVCTRTGEGGFDEMEMVEVVWLRVLSWPWNFSRREMFESLENAPPRHPRHFTLFSPQLVNGAEASI